MPEGWELVGSSQSARVAFHSGKSLYYKEFLPRGPLEALKALFRGSRATRARLNSEALLRAGIQAPRNVAWGRLPNNREYLYTEAAPGEGVTRWLRDHLAQREGEDLTTRRQLLRELGHFIGRVHAAGFIHGDLRTSNVLASRGQSGFEFTLIDNERNLHTLPAPGRGLLRNLMQLNMLPPAQLSRGDRMRFFCAWRTEMNDLSDIETKVLAAEAYHWAMRRLYDKGKL
jgi:serine/threonine protein kinase